MLSGRYVSRFWSAFNIDSLQSFPADKEIIISRDLLDREHLRTGWRRKTVGLRMPECVYRCSLGECQWGSERPAGPLAPPDLPAPPGVFPACFLTHPDKTSFSSCLFPEGKKRGETAECGYITPYIYYLCNFLCDNLLQVFQPTGFHPATNPLSWKDILLSPAVREQENKEDKQETQ